METPTKQAERERYEAWLASLPNDDEPLDDEDRDAIDEPRNPADHIELEAYLAGRTDGAA